LIVETDMERRSFLSRAGAGLGVGAALLAAPAMTKAQPAVRWRCTSGVPRALDVIFGGAEAVAQRVSDATGGRFQITVAPVGEIVPLPQAADAVMAGTVESAHIWTGWYMGKEPTWVFGSTIPFGLNQRQHNAWWKRGGGATMFNDWLRPHGVQFIMAGNSGAQMGGWFRREVRTAADVRGLKIRIPGLPGQIWHAAGAVPQMIPPADIYSALERGAIDAAEWVGPHDDERLGFHRIARFYYYPGWHEGSGTMGFLVNNRVWEALPADYRFILTAAAHEANLATMAHYDVYNELALRRLVAGGTQLREFPRPLLETLWDHAQAIYADLSRASADFKRFYEHYSSFQRRAAAWSRLQEASYDGMIAHLLRRRPAAAGGAERRPS
jgi:TRAP-type mannitol/chloroaromatic compound transport system substrate-binding protein